MRKIECPITLDLHILKEISQHCQHHPQNQVIQMNSVLSQVQRVVLVKSVSIKRKLARPAVKYVKYSR